MTDAATRGEPSGSCVGYLAMVAVVLLAIVWMCLPPLPLGSPRRAMRTLCTSRLKQILYGCLLYAEDNADACPPDLSALFGDYVTDSHLFVCPFASHDGRVLEPESDTFVPDAVCYAYVSGLRASDDAEFVIAFDEEWNHEREGVVVVYVGGQVVWRRDIEALHSELKKQRAALAAKGRTMRIIRPPWSREPDPPDYPDYPVRPWHERPGPVVGVLTLALAIVGGAIVLILIRRRAAMPAGKEPAE